MINIFEEQKVVPGLLGAEKIMLGYCIFTALLGVVLYGQLENGAAFMGLRLLFVLATLALYWLYQRKPCDATHVLRLLFQVALLGNWYPDIYQIACHMQNYDPFFAQMDQNIFGCQPSIVLSQTLSGPFWRELFYMGYFSYFLMIIGVVVYALFFCYRRFDRTVTEMLTCFVGFYLIYLFLQAAGPQFYFPFIGMDKAAAGVFTPVGDWFRSHTELLWDHNQGGFFQTLVALLHKSEYPIAAFPSSHVGLATVIIILMYKMKKTLALCVFPFYVILCISTVYIGAHYAVDVFAGLICGVLFYLISERIYNHRYFHRPKSSTLHHRAYHHHNRHHSL